MPDWPYPGDERGTEDQLEDSEEECCAVDALSVARLNEGWDDGAYAWEKDVDQEEQAPVAAVNLHNWVITSVSAHFSSKFFCLSFIQNLINYIKRKFAS